MRTLALILVLALAARAEDRTAMLDRMLRAGAGTPVRVQLEDRTVVSGRLLRVTSDVLQLQVAAAGAIQMPELPVARIVSFRVLRESEFSRGFRQGAGRALGAIAVLMVLGLVGALINH